MCRAAIDGGRRCPKHSSPEYREQENARRRLQYAQERQKPLSDTIYRRHLEYAYTTTEKLHQSGKTTINAHSYLDENGSRVWSEERSRAHQGIVNYFIKKWEDVPQNKQAVISGGLAGSGKTSTLENHAGIVLEEFALLSPDEIKEVMAHQGLFPKISGLTPMESSAVGYEEATYLTNLLLTHATRDGYNIIYDTTMGSVDATVHKLEPMRNQGYDIHAVFVEIDVDTSLRRSQERHRAGLNKFLLHGEGNGGRLMPRSAILSQRVEGSASSRNVEVFEKLEHSGWFHTTKVFDNNVDGRPPVRLR